MKKSNDKESDFSQSGLTIFLEGLKKKALDYGASDAKIIAAEKISIEDNIIDLCKTPRCESYGKNANCPPFAAKPSEARKLIGLFSKALIFKIDVDPSFLMSDRNDKAFRPIYEIGSKLESEAIRAGFESSKSLAAGSCLHVLCKGRACSVIAEDQPCRHPFLARSSMEAVGINVFKLIQNAGWEIYAITKDSDPKKIPAGVLAGLVLVGA
jgi:predicted metal-binding protein